MKLTSPSPFLSLLLIPTLVVLPLSGQTLVASSDSGVVSAPASSSDNSDLQIHLVAGMAKQAKVSSTTNAGVIVAVTNASGAAVPDAAVALRMPDSGPTATFADGSHAAVAYTDAAGQAHFPAVRWNEIPGVVVMRVTATKGTSHAAILLDETLTSEATTVVQLPSSANPNPPAPSVQQPGQLAPLQPASKTGASASPVISPASPTAVPAVQPPPSVSVTGASPDSAQHSSKTKWIIIAVAVAAAAGAGMAFAGKGKSTPSTTSNSLTIGSPSVSVGAP